MVPIIKGCKLMELPLEVFEGIIQHLLQDDIQHDLISLSSTNRTYRELLASRIFHLVILTNNERSGAALEAIADGKFAHRVKQLHYKGIVPTPEGLELPTETCPLTPIPFPKSVQSMLSHLERLPCLQSFIMDFPFKEWDHFMDPYDQFDELEKAQEIRKAENENGWRVLMRQSFDALSLNDCLATRNLEIRQLTPFAVSTFDTPAFHHILGLLKGFSLSLRGWDNGFGSHLNILPATAEFALRLGPWFFDHLGDIESLMLEASDSAPIGLIGSNHLPLAFKMDHMPVLRFLRVRYLFICKELSNFIAAHADVLEEIVMVDCMASTYPNNDMAWSTFFDIIAEANPSKLRKLDIMWTEESVPEWDSRVHLTSYEEWKMDSEKIERILQDDPEAIMFNYANLCGTYGDLSQHDQDMRSSFIEGSDQQAYKRLMGLINKNRTSHSSDYRNTSEPNEHK